jgi:outer membrane receptor protein involved in Fe transport
VHYVGQGGETFINNKDATAFRKIREWTTVDAIVSYTFNLAAPATENQVAGYAKDGNTAVKMKDGKDKNLMPISTAQYSSCGWRAWLNATTITAGMNNIFNLDPPFAATASENGYVESTFDIKGRFWYVSLKKKF